MNEYNIKTTQDLLSFINDSPTAFQTIARLSRDLNEGGYTQLFENEAWNLLPGGKYYLNRNQTSLIAFRIPFTYAQSFAITASHSDSPTFKLKNEYEVETFSKYIKLNTEVYGGMILSSWFDRPLSIAGRVIINKDGGFRSLPVVIDRDLAVIPNVAIHFNRNINDGYKYNPSIDTFPLLSSSSCKGALKRFIAEAINIDETMISGMDLYLYNRTCGTIWGAENEFFSAPRIDDLMCAYGTFEGFIKADEGSSIPVYCVFDNEEVGSSTKQGAGSFLLHDTLMRICEGFSKDLRVMLASSFMVSADNAHARHPNHPEFSDGQNSPDMNGGIVIKSNASQAYTTDALSSSVFTELCHRAGVPIQHFENRSDLRGGSTLGHISNTIVPVCTVDIGLAQLAMHSSYETAGCADTAYLIKSIKTFYETNFYYSGSGSCIIK